MRSPNTQTTYRGIIREWCNFLGAEAGTKRAATLMLSATDLNAAEYREWLSKQAGERPRHNTHSVGTRPSHEVRVARRHEGRVWSLSNATIAKKFAALRRMYRALMNTGFPVVKNPFDSDATPPPPKDSGRKRPTEMLDFGKVRDILAAADDTTPKGLRDKAILSVLFGGGLRRSEVLALRVGDVRKSDAGTVFLYLRATKSNRDASQALPGWAADTVRRLVAQRASEGAGPADYLFIGYTGRAGQAPSGRKISASGVYQLFRTYCRRAGATGHLSPHSARATAITKLLEEGIPHREVQEFSRHASIQMVELYDKRRISVDENAAKDLDY